MRISDWIQTCALPIWTRECGCVPNRGSPAGGTGADRGTSAAGQASATDDRDARAATAADRTSVVWGKSVSVRVDLGGRRMIKKKNRAADHGPSRCRYPYRSRDMQ